MTELVIQASNALRGRVHVPGDKSISHRALMLGALADGPSQIRNFSPSGDPLATLACLRELGITIEQHSPTRLTVHGRGLSGLRRPAGPLYCDRSGTTMRLLAGILAGQSFDSTLTGDPQLLRRPMNRVSEPLARMGATIDSTAGRAPLVIHGHPLLGGEHQLQVASAQVKSALLLAGLYAGGPTTIHLPGPARDHTEIMLRSQLGPRRSQIRFDAQQCHLDPAGIDRLEPLDLTIPGDFSSAAFVLAAGLLVPNSDLVIQDINTNPTRTGLLDVLALMGADIRLENAHTQGGEPVANLVTRPAPHLNGATIGGDLVVRMIDEFPILAVIASQAVGVTVVRDATELRVKETDRIATVVTELLKMGVDIEPRPDGFVVRGPTQLHGATVDSHDDHRLAMALAIAGLLANGETRVQRGERFADSFPTFVETLLALGATVEIRS